jgi:DNA-binding CsgD family transcriptional regulator
VVRKLTAEQIVELARRYRAGATVRELAREYEVHRQTVTGHLHSQGVEIRQRGLRADHIDQAVTLYKRGASLECIGQRLGASAGTVRKELMIRGVPMRTSYDHLLH